MVPADILDFWFSPETGSNWFGADAEFDETIRLRFAAIYTEASDGKLTGWQIEAGSALALVIVLDQFPRNMFRNSPRAFATDPQALFAAEAAIAAGFDKGLATDERQFLYMPFMHAEDLAAGSRGGAVQGPGRCGDAWVHAAAPRYHRALRPFSAS